MSRSLGTWVRWAGAGLVFAVLVWRLGTSPFLDGFRMISAGALAAAAGITLLTTIGYAWRWRIVAGGLGLDLPAPVALAAYYRALFLNLTLPGGVAGDVHRGARHGREVKDVGHALRAVAWERFAGQVVQVLLTVVVLLVLPSPLRSLMPVVAGVLLLTGIGVVLAARLRPRGSRSRVKAPGGSPTKWARLRRGAAGDIRAGLLPRRAWPAIALASMVGVGGHAAIFLIAARTAGVSASAQRMLPIALIVLAATVLPNIAGWGPREGVAAWVFGAAGLGAGRGVTTAVVYGVMMLVATLPGMGVLLVAWFHRDRPPGRTRPRPRRAAHA